MGMGGGVRKGKGLSAVKAGDADFRIESCGMSVIKFCEPSVLIRSRTEKRITLRLID